MSRPIFYVLRPPTLREALHVGATWVLVAIFAVLALRFLVGCREPIGPDPDASSEQHIGDPPAQRLILQVERSEELERVVGWYDTELDTPCSGAMYVDGSRYCLPLADGPYAGGIAHVDRRVFSDAACSTEIFVAPAAVACQRFIRSSLGVAVACGQYVTFVLDVSAAEPAPTDLWAYDALDECVAVSGAGLIKARKVKPSDLATLEVDP